MNTNADKEKIIQLMNLWLDRSGFQFRQTARWLQLDVAGLLEDTAKSKLTAHPKRPPNIEPELAIAVIKVFSQRPGHRNERCTAEEALTFASLARLPIDQIDELRPFFDADDFTQALSLYVKSVHSGHIVGKLLAMVVEVIPRVGIQQAQTQAILTASVFMPLYQGDKLMTEEQASVRYLCQNKMVFHVPEERLARVNCERSSNQFFIGSLDSLGIDDLTMQFSLNETTKTILYSWLAQTQQDWPRVINLLTQALDGMPADVSSQHAYLHQQMADAYYAQGAWAEAKTHYQQMLTDTKTAHDTQGQMIATFALARLAYVQQDGSSAETYLSQLSALDKAQAYQKSIHLLQLVISPDTAKEQGQQVYLGELILTNFVQYLAQQSYPNLTAQFQQIPESFMKRLALLLQGGLELKPGMVGTLSVNDTDLALELLAATFVATQTFMARYPVETLETYHQSGALDMLIESHGLDTARNQIGLEDEQAEMFAKAYGQILIQNIETLLALKQA